MAFHLDTTLQLPLEREHEGWAIRGIEDYAEASGLKVQSYAVSPADEIDWPADEALTFRSKFFGLQFKRPYLHSGLVRWEIKPASLQFQRICANPEIFYALPTFTNRALRRNALQHCLFWRPCPCCCDSTAASLLNSTWQDQDDLVSCGCMVPMRWGDFVESLYRCELVEPSAPGAQLSELATRLLGAFREQPSNQSPEQRGAVTEDDGETEALQLIALEVPAVD
ncbi:hypothetical protein C8244_06965 [Paracidovorax avenae]|uniref:hypothetical protein n=1 Tax=Paracidovorax avenae TaxID=80867 RepID=UPI000D160A38|nr:hypothetical protein [Paracidovorax avenae]AVS80760.1 hypothetical protein C8237_06390 [Paracidovorax avenae]AVT15989.1 hypothetical protein C8244_06965 [Paracidovorax avenae]